MYSNGNARSAVSQHARDASSMPSDHTSSALWERSGFTRDKFERPERDKYTSAKNDWATDNRPSSTRSSNALFSNSSYAPPPAKRRALGRHGPIHENVRHTSTTGCPSVLASHLRLPVENSKAERDFTGGLSPAYSSSPSTEKPTKDSDGHHFRGLSPCETRLASSPSFDPPPSRLYGKQNGLDGIASRERERSKSVRISQVWDTSYRERDYKERGWVRPEYHRRTLSLPKLDSPRDWNGGDRELVEGRIDRYGSGSTRDLAFSDVLNTTSKERYRYDWRSRDRSFFRGFSSRSSAASSKNHVLDIGTGSTCPEVSRASSPPNQAASQGRASHESYHEDAGSGALKKRPRLTWGQGLAKYEKEKVEDDPCATVKSKNCQRGMEDFGELHAGEGVDASLKNYNQSLQKGDVSPRHKNSSELEELPDDSGCNQGMQVDLSSEFSHDLKAVSPKVVIVGQEVSFDARSKDLRMGADTPLSPRVALVQDRALVPAAAEYLDVHDVQVPQENVFMEGWKSKDALMQEVEKVELEIERREKELLGLDSELYTYEPLPSKEDERSLQEQIFSMHGAPDSNLHLIGAEESESLDDNTAVRPQHSDCILASTLTDSGSESLSLPLHDASVRVQEVPGQESSKEVVLKGPKTKLASGFETPDQVLVAMDSLNENIVVSSGQKGELQGKFDWRVGGLPTVITLSNQRIGDRTLKSLSHLNSFEMGKIRQCGSLYGSPQESTIWTLNEESHSRKRKLIESKVLEERALRRFIEVNLAAKCRPLRETMKQKQSGGHSKFDYEKTPIVSLRDEKDDSNLTVQQSLLNPGCDTGSLIIGGKNEDHEKARQLNVFCIGRERGFLRMPSMHLGKRERHFHKFETQNGLVEDPVSAEQERKAFNPWSTEEKKLFLDKYFLFGKDFRRIASSLEHKTVADCVEFYYRNQKSEEFEKVRSRHQLIRRKDYQPSAPYLTTTTLWSRKQSEGKMNIAGLEGLTLVAAAAAAMSVPKKFSIVSPWAELAIAGDTKHFSQALSSTEGINEERRGGKGARSTHTRPKAYKEEIDQQWSEKEKKALVNAVVMFGKNFYSISQHIGTKSERQCKTFFSKACKELALDQLVVRHNVILQASENEIATPLIRDTKGKPDTCADGSPSQDQCMLEKFVSSAVGPYDCAKSVSEPPEKNCQHDGIVGISVSSLVCEVGHAEDLIPEGGVSKCAPCVSNVIKQEAFILPDNGGRSVDDGVICKPGNCQVNGAPSVEPLNGCSLEESLVCGEVLQFKTEALIVKVDSTLAGNSANPLCNGTLSHIHTMSPSLVSVLVPNSLPVSPLIPSAQVKDQSTKTEIKARREPTSWTQEEKDKFAEVLKECGKSWDRLRDNLPGKSLTQIKTYFQNSKAKLGFGVENQNGRVSFIRKKKVDDSDSSSNAGSGGKNISQTVAMFADDGSLKVSPSMFVPSGGLGIHGQAGDPLMYSNVFTKNSLEDPPQKVFHSLGLNTSTAGIHPLLNSAVFTSPNLRASQQPFGHANVAKAQQVVGLQQPQQATSPFGVVPLQQPIGSVGVHQTHQLQQPSLPQPAGRMLQELVLPPVQQLHKQPDLPQSEGIPKALFQQQQQQQVAQQLQQQVTEAVLHQQSSPQLLQRQQQMRGPALPHHNFQQVLSQHLAHSKQQAPNQLPLGSSQPACAQIASVIQPISANQQPQQRSDLFQSQLYQMHTKSAALLQQHKQTQQLQLLQLHWQQQHAQVHQAQAKLVENQVSNVQPPTFTLLNEQPQQLSVLRGIVQATSACTEPTKQPDVDLSNFVKRNRGVCEDSQSAVVSQIAETPINSQAVSDPSRAGDVKLFGQFLLSQPVASNQQSSGRLSSPSPQVPFSAPFSGFITGKNPANTALQPLPDAFIRYPGWQTALPATTPIVSNGLSNVLASCNASVSPQGTDSGQLNVHEAVSCTIESSIREAGYQEAGGLSEGTAKALSNVLVDSANQHLESKRHENVTGSDHGISVNKSREEECSQNASWTVGHAASQGLPRVLDALAALAEWRLQNVNGGSGRLTDEFLSQSWEALQKDPGSLVEARKVGGSLAQMCTGSGETLQQLEDNLSSFSASRGEGIWAGPGGPLPLSNAQNILAQSPSLLRHNGEVGILEVREIDGRGGGAAG